MNLRVAAQQLASGQTVKIRPHGNSMSGRIESGQLVTIKPITDEELAEGDIVLAKVRGRYYVHLIAGISAEGRRPRYLICNNKGFKNGWVYKTNIYGRVINIEP